MTVCCVLGGGTYIWYIDSWFRKIIERRMLKSLLKGPFPYTTSFNQIDRAFHTKVYKETLEISFAPSKDVSTAVICTFHLFICSFILFMQANSKVKHVFVAEWFRKLYEWTKLPLVPLYGGFPVKLRYNLSSTIIIPFVCNPEQKKNCDHTCDHGLCSHVITAKNILRLG